MKIDSDEAYRDLATKHVKDFALSLDRRIPGWFNEIDTTLLDMTDTETCIGGQLGWERAVAPSHNSVSNIRNRFALGIISIGNTFRMFMLKDLWIEQILERREGGMVEA